MNRAQRRAAGVRAMAPTPEKAMADWLTATMQIARLAVACAARTDPRFEGFDRRLLAGEVRVAVSWGWSGVGTHGVQAKFRLIDAATGEVIGDFFTWPVFGSPALNVEQSSGRSPA